MLNQLDDWRRSEWATVGLALASSIFFASLFWIWERELMWMLAVVLPPIWSPVIYRRFGREAEAPASRRLLVGAVAGLVALLVIGIVAFLVV